MTLSFKGEIYRNIIASTGPDLAPRIIFGAHYDVCGEQPGADDNASVVVGLLELARIMATKGETLRHWIDFAAYTLEEPPATFTQYMGSAVHAQSLKNNGVNVAVMIALEMIGYFSDAPKSQGYPVMVSIDAPDTGNFIAVIGRPSEADLVQKITKGIQQTSFPAEAFLLTGDIPGVSWSDHWGFWRYGFPAVMVTDTAFYRNPNYHQTSDTIDTLDFQKMNRVVQGLYSGIMELEKK